MGCVQCLHISLIGTPSLVGGGLTNSRNECKLIFNILWPIICHGRASKCYIVVTGQKAIFLGEKG